MVSWCRRRVRQTTVSAETGPRRFPSGRHGVRPGPGERSALDGSASLTGTALAPKPLRSKDVRHQGSVRSEGCARRKLPRGSRRHRARSQDLAVAVGKHSQNFQIGSSDVSPQPAIAVQVAVQPMGTLIGICRYRQALAPPLQPVPGSPGRQTPGRPTHQ